MVLSYFFLTRTKFLKTVLIFCFLVLSEVGQRPVSDVSRPVGDLSISGGVCIESLCQRPVNINVPEHHFCFFILFITFSIGDEGLGMGHQNTVHLFNLPQQCTSVPWERSTPLSVFLMSL